MKHIGIAGITVPGSLLCINTIVEESYKHFGKKSMIHPRITYTNPPFIDVEKPMVEKKWDQVAKDLLLSIDILYRAGADFVIIPSNHPHYAIEEIQRKSPIPVLSILDITTAECRKRKFKKVGILGVIGTMAGGLYIEPLKKQGLEPLNLSPKRQKEFSDLIFNEIIIGKPDKTIGDKMRIFIQELKDMGADSFIAGCTEIPVVIASESESPLPFIDTTRLLAKKALEYAIETKQEN